MAKSAHLSRNDFVKGTVGILGTVMGAAIAAPAVAYVLSPALNTTTSDTWVALGPLENYPVGVPTLFNFTRSKVNGWEKTTNSYGVYVYKKSDTEVTTYSNVCTHLSCRVNWTEDVQEFLCPCHDAAFDINGQVVDGPPPKPLYQYENKIENGELFIHFEEF